MAPIRVLLGRPVSALKLLALFAGILLVLSFAATAAASKLSNPRIPVSEVTSSAAIPATSCPLSSLDPVVLDQSFDPYSLDPAIDYSYSAWAAMQQVYQTLVLYNGSSATTFYGVLADSWTVSPDGYNNTFHLRTGAHFSNGDPVTAYTIWFSLYRVLAVNATPSFMLSENFWLPGITYYSSASEQTNAYNYLVNALDTWDFTNPTASQLAGMMATNQSFQIVDAQTITLRTGEGYLGPLPYTYLLATLATPVASAVDPVVVQANGGVGGAGTWMADHMLGTGPYLLSTYSPSGGYTLLPDPNYWGKATAALEPWNIALRPAQSSIQVRTQANAILRAQDLASGNVAGIPPDGLDPTYMTGLASNPCVVTHKQDPIYGSVLGGWWVYMNQEAAPFNNLSVREAVAHAINYDQIINVAFGGNAERWVGPVPPGYPYSNPQGLAPYSFDLARAMSAMNRSPWPLPVGYPNPLNYVYLNEGVWPVVAILVQTDLAKIGIPIHPVGVDLGTLFTIETQDLGVCLSDTSYRGGPFYIGQDFWLADYIAPDDWTQAIALNYGSTNLCLSHYSNATTDFLVLDAASQSSSALVSQDYSRITQIMDDNYTNAWLVVPDQFQAYHPSLRGLVANPMGQAADFAMTFNTLYAVPPIRALFAASPAPGTANETLFLVAEANGGTPPYTYQWQFGDGSTTSGSATNVSHVYAAAGNYTANLTVRDSYGGYTRFSMTVTVSPAPGPSPPLLTIPLVAIAGIGIALAAAAAILVHLLIRRPRKPEQPPPPAQPPTTPPSP